MNENVIFKKYEFDKPVVQKIDSIIDNCIRDCNYKYFHRFDHICENNIPLTNTTDNEIVNFTISAKIMVSYELNKKIPVARQNGSNLLKKKLTIKIYSNFSHINLHHYLKLQIPIMHRQFFKKLSQNPDYIQTHCKDRTNPFLFACRKWYLYNSPQSDMV